MITFQKHLKKIYNRNIRKAKKQIDSMLKHNQAIDDIIDYIQTLQSEGLVDTWGFHVLIDYHYSKIRRKKLVRC